MTENQSGKPENSNSDDSQDSAGNGPTPASSTQEVLGSGTASDNSDSSDANQQASASAAKVENEKSNVDNSSDEGDGGGEASNTAKGSDAGSRDNNLEDTTTDPTDSGQPDNEKDGVSSEIVDQEDATISESERIQDEEKEQEDKRPLMERVLDKLLNLRERITGEKPDLDVPETFKQDMEKLENLTKELEEDNKKQHEHLLRLSAEFENFKKRTANNIQMEKERAQQQAIGGLFPVMDSLEMSINFEPDPAKAEQLMGTMQEGLKLVSKQMESFLVSIGLTPIDALGQDFDPELHEALEATGEGTTYKVMEEIQRGFMQKGRVIRPAKVKVQAMPQKEETALDTTEKVKEKENVEAKSAETSEATEDCQDGDSPSTEASDTVDRSDETQSGVTENEGTTEAADLGANEAEPSSQVSSGNKEQDESKDKTANKPPEPKPAPSTEEDKAETKSDVSTADNQDGEEPSEVYGGGKDEGPEGIAETEK